MGGTSGLFRASCSNLQHHASGQLLLSPGGGRAPPSYGDGEGRYRRGSTAGRTWSRQFAAEGVLAWIWLGKTGAGAWPPSKEAASCVVFVTKIKFVRQMGTHTNA